MDPKIEIEFEETSRRYNPGEEIEGRVIIISNGTDSEISEIIIRLTGRRVALTSPEKPEEFYFCENQITLLHKEEILKQDQMLEYPFNFNLPSELPASFRASRAFVEYQLTVTVKRISDFDLTSKSPFYINGVLILENNETSPIEIRQSKTVGCFSCFNWRSSHRFGFTAKLLKSQYLPGDNIDFVVEIWNSSKLTLGDAKISLIRELRILDAGNFHTVLKEYGLISELQGPIMVSPGCKTTWSSSSLDNNDADNNFQPLLNIPEDTPPTHLGCRKFIDLNYFVKISIISSGFCSSTLYGKIPVIIGSSFN